MVDTGNRIVAFLDILGFEELVKKYVNGDDKENFTLNNPVFLDNFIKISSVNRIFFYFILKKINFFLCPTKIPSNYITYVQFLIPYLHIYVNDSDLSFTSY